MMYINIHTGQIYDVYKKDVVTVKEKKRTTEKNVLFMKGSSDEFRAVDDWNKFDTFIEYK
jgi:hypothetical protein